MIRSLLASALTLFAIVLVALASTRVRAQDVPRIWQGVYTGAQAERGKATFDTACIRCHGGDLAGTTAPALKGDRFQATYGNETVDRLFLKIRDTMPPNFGTVLTDSAKIDIVSYILQANGYPAGPRELATSGDELGAIQILRKGEQASVNNFSLIQTVGCLAKGPNDSWLLTSTAEPVATRDDAPGGEALGAAAAKPLGTGQFLLLSAAPHRPADHVGRKMEVRGLVYRDAVDARLTVTSLQPVGECPSSTAQSRTEK
jgi:mono/diheme cytochrome c family protein